ncbi:small subunit processome component 20 homolog isoform X2 [Patiria miniata]|uniref:U3 small nucleolar RNA-associated protein 20 C-terminal domain-containing protein n=1 Tax=Patiria miniata TaxID=46514 RepID=A0A914ACT9_PATMI|nr:small subunit processome component 20 homolog isoform X2 [Patiria miniata]
MQASVTYAMMSLPILSDQCSAATTHSYRVWDSASNFSPCAHLKSQSKSKKNKKQADNFPEYLLSLLEFSPELLRQDNVVSVLWAALVCLPSTRPLDKARVVPKLNSLITTLGDVAENQKDETVKDMLLYLLSVAVCSLLQCGQGQPMQSLVQEDFVWNILRTNPTCVHALLIGDLYITQLVRDQDGSFLAADKLKLIFPALQPNLSSPHKKVTVVALRCITWMLRYPLPSISKSAFRLTKILFKILHTHAMAGAAKGANFDIVVSCFKAVTVLVRDVKQHMIDEKQLQVLLTYAEEDMHDHTRQATAFGLLKAILSRKLIVPEMHDVIKKVAQLSITSESPSVRLQCRQVVLNFLLDYPLGNKLKRHLEFYVRQLNFDLETGRESSLEMLATIFSSFPQKTLETYAGMFFIPMATRLVNDESAKCHKITALAIKSLLQKLRVEKRDKLFTMVTHWLHDDNPAHQHLASQLCGIFVDAEEAGFQRRLDDILPQIQEHIKPDGLQKDGMSAMETDDTSVEERHTDHMLFNLLSALAKMIKHCSIIGNKAYTDTLNAIWDSIQSHLLHPHSWVRLVSAQLFGHLFASKQPDIIAGTMLKAASGTWTTNTSANENRMGKKTKRKRKADKERGGVTGKMEAVEYPLNHGQEIVRELVFTFCKQFQSALLNKDLGDQVVRNLVFLGKVIHRLYPDKTEIYQTEERLDSEDENDDENDERTPKLSAEQNTTNTDKQGLGRRTPSPADLTWFLRRMCRIAASEAAKTPKQTLRRTCVVKWLAAMAMDVGGDRLPSYLKLMMKPMCREIGDQKSHADNDLRQLCQEALDLIKGLVGLETFSHAYADVQRVITQTRIQRKQQRALQAVADPVQAAKHKEKKHQNKKEAKKRRLQQLRPRYHIVKKAKLSDGT